MEAPAEYVGEAKRNIRELESILNSESRHRSRVWLSTAPLAQFLLMLRNTVGQLIRALGKSTLCWYRGCSGIAALD